MDDQQVITSTIPHSDFGDERCCGCLNGVIRGGLGAIICNECGVIVCMLAAADLESTLAEMETAGDFARGVCLHCGARHVAPGFSKLVAFVCNQCGKGVKVIDEHEL